MNPSFILRLLTALLFSSSVLAATVHCRSDMYQAR
ncbi:hypothetical protein SAMN05216419_10674 [Nitrosomonas cryotolerans]|nr:hypothetical protein SAMN05216419_10674 [Nitrosomonas cryotolerans]